jgi:hypothetical protein
MKKQHLTCFLFLFISSFVHAQHHTISGFITNDKNGETLINSIIFEKNNQKGSVSNSYGFPRQAGYVLH